MAETRRMQKEAMQDMNSHLNSGSSVGCHHRNVHVIAGQQGKALSCCVPPAGKQAVHKFLNMSRAGRQRQLQACVAI